MIFPLEQLVSFNGNIYEATSAAARRAYQLAVIRGEEVEENAGKVVSLAAKQIFTSQIQYRIENK